MEPEYIQVQNPKTGRYIDLYGDAYNNLLKNGFTEAQLMKKTRKSTKTPKSPKIRQKYIETNKRIISNLLPDEIIFEEIIMQMKDPDFMSICKSNKKFYALCNNELFWEKMYLKYYGDSKMNETLPDVTYFELFKICYNLTFIQQLYKQLIGFIRTLNRIYNSKSIMLDILSIIKHYKTLMYMIKLKNLTIFVKNFENQLPNNIVNELNKLPNLTEITYKKQL